jgi:hypothetical protein
MMSLSAFVVPVMLDTNSDAGHIARQWARLYHYGHIYLPGLCIATCVLYGYSSLRQHRSSRKYVLAAMWTIAMVPFTWIVMVPTNNLLFGLDEAARSGSVVGLGNLGLVHGLAVKWAWLHATRSLSPLIGSYLGLTGVLQELAG